MKKKLVLSSSASLTVNNAEGFTLVEILVVVTIISLLASIAAVSYSQFIKQSRDTRRKTDIEQIRAAIELYQNFNNVYPADIAFGGVIADPEPSTTKYMTKVPNDPRATSSLRYTYYYLSIAPFKDYKLCAYIEGGETSISDADCSPTLKCNYCMGPYGQL